MPELTNTVLSVDTTLPAHERYIALTEADFNGGTGEGDFINSNGPDTIDVYGALKRTGHKLSIRFREGTGNTGATYSLILRINPTVKLFPHSARYKFPLGEFQTDHIDNPREVDSNAPEILLSSVAGQYVTYELDNISIRNISIDGAAAAFGTLAELVLTIF